MSRLGCGIGLLALMMGSAGADAQSAANMAVLRGLAPISALSNSASGRDALASNYTVTGGIQTGAIRQPNLLPFAEQQQQALRDAFITDGNLAQLADGLGTTLGAAYQARAHYLDRERFTNVSKAVADVIAYANSTTGSIRTPANTSSPTARQTAKSRFPTTPWPSSKMSTARPILLAAAMADRPELPAPTPSGIPVLSDRAHDPADRGTGLLQCSGQQRRL